MRGYSLIGLLAGLMGLGACMPVQLSSEEIQRLRTPTAQALPKAQQSQLDTWLREGGDSLRRGELKATLKTWRQFLEQGRGHPRFEDVRGYVTLVRRLDARQSARALARQEGERATAPTGERVLAIFPLENVVHTTRLGPKKPFHQAVLAWITADLLKVPGLKIVERQYLRALLDELALAESALADPDSRLRVGRLLGATEVVNGVVEDYDDDNYDEGEYEVATAMVRVADGESLGEQEAEGPRKDFVEILKEVEVEILLALGITEIPPEIGTAHTTNWEAYAEFAIGLDRVEQGRFDEAREAFARALNADPAFDLASDALLETPARELTPEEMATRAESF